MQADTPRRGYRIGEMDVCFRSEILEVTEDFEALYGWCREDRVEPSSAIQIDVRSERRSVLGRKRPVIHGKDGQLWSPHGEGEILPYVEWGINWQIMDSRHEFLQIHAACMARNGQGLLLAGRSGSGKSTLAAGLLARGWQYLSDEFALIDPEDRTLHAFPKAMCIKEGSFEVVKGLGLPLHRRRHYVKVFKGPVGYLNVHSLDPDAIGGPCPIRTIVLPRYDEANEPSLRPLSRAEAAFLLAELAFNRMEFGCRAMSILSGVVRGADCYQLDSGPIGATCDALEALVARASCP